MADQDFINSLNLRKERMKKLFNEKTPVPPLILRGSDMLIFDGYARSNTLKHMGIKKCLAYVSHKS